MTDCLAGQGCRACFCMGRSRSSSSAVPPPSMRLVPKPAMHPPMGAHPCQTAQCPAQPSTAQMQRPEALPVRSSIHQNLATSSLIIWLLAPVLE